MGDACNLLTKEDHELIESIGAPIGIRGDLLVETGNGSNVSFTIKGLQFYKFACRRYSVLIPLREITTRLAALRLGGHLMDARICEQTRKLEHQLVTGTIEPRNREAVRALIYGSVVEWQRAEQQRQECAVAGTNVIPVLFGK